MAAQDVDRAIHTTSIGNGNFQYFPAITGGAMYVRLRADNCR